MYTCKVIKDLHVSD